MSSLTVYDPPQCCSTGVCGPEVDQQLAEFAAALEWLRAQGVKVARFDLGHDPGEFVQNASVKGALEAEGIGVLPLVMVEGRVFAKGRYPSRAELAARLGIAAGEEKKRIAIAAAPCCAPAPAAAGAGSERSRSCC